MTFLMHSGFGKKGLNEDGSLSLLAEQAFLLSIAFGKMDAVLHLIQLLGWGKEEVSNLTIQDYSIPAWSIVYQRHSLFTYLASEFDLNPLSIVVNKQDPSTSILHLMAEFGSTSLLENFLRVYSTVPVDRPNQDGQTPLMLAVRSKNYEVVPLLLALHVRIKPSLAFGHLAWLRAESIKQESKEKQTQTLLFIAPLRRKTRKGKREKKEGEEVESLESQDSLLSSEEGFGMLSSIRRKVKEEYLG